MPNALAFIGGGLLQGIGKGLVLDGKEKRERALAALEHKRTLERDEKKLEGLKGLLGTRIEANTAAVGVSTGIAETAATTLDTRKVEASKTSSDVSTTTATVLDKRKVDAARLLAENRKDTAKIKAGKSADSSAAEKRAFDSLVEIHTVADENGLEATDWSAVADGLNEKGFGKLAKAARSRGKGIDDLEIRKRAELFADEMVKEQSGRFSFDSSDFKDDGGSRVKFRARMVREFIAKNSGQAPDAPATRPATAPATEPPAAGKVPYTGDAPPPGFPNARPGKGQGRGFWFVPDPARPGKFNRVLSK